MQHTQLLQLQLLLNSLWPNDAIWRHISGSTLAQVMPCCLTAPSHYLNQCWLIISGVLQHAHQSNYIGCVQEFNLQHELENYSLKILPHPLGANELILATHNDLIPGVDQLLHTVYSHGILQVGVTISFLRAEHKTHTQVLLKYGDFPHKYSQNWNDTP